MIAPFDPTRVTADAVAVFTDEAPDHVASDFHEARSVIAALKVLKAHLGCDLVTAREATLQLRPDLPYLFR